MPDSKNLPGIIPEEAGWNLDNSYARLPERFFTAISPTPVQSPRLIILNNLLAESLGLNIEVLQSQEGVQVLAGNKLAKNSLPLAQAYAGHQFGHFTMLGDGRALLLGEQLTPQGARLDIQLKGAGKTPYSRGGDGRAALGPMLREYIVSEAMHALGIPTTRSLAVVTTGEPVLRETVLPGAVLTRVATSHLRVGTFEYAAKWGGIEDLKTLSDYTLKRHFPGADGGESRHLLLLREVIKRQAALIAKWQLVGFVHGVMNTDNMALSGETIDYGPCAFMDTYDPATVFSSIDIRGRYAYGNQPHIALWNLARFAATLLPLLHEEQSAAVKLAEDELSAYNNLYHHNWLSGMRAKLGLFNEEPEDEALIIALLGLMEKYRTDYTNTFKELTFDITEGGILSISEFDDWKKQWLARVGRQEASREASHRLMQNSNPALIPRNHRVEEALESAVTKGEFAIMRQLLRALAHPYAHSDEQACYASPPEATARPYRTFCGT